ncbi:hypothetical protein ALC62_09895 [Cyphomyrmex costatus]|uniref:Mutator-like transposase domain-containing protein n=1 Tax=Cyphomyrmex costatus TaxID=456900 RepID=A0A151IEZ4_9HYME|nr:hypothetical protein ALC62_09895 [Cyphomyrmex costatus]
MFGFYSEMGSPQKESTKRRAVRILSQRYDLTATGYKFLEISVNVGPSSYVEIVLGDHQGRELSMSLETWKGLYEQRLNIYKLLRNEYKDNFITVGPITATIKINQQIFNPGDYVFLLNKARPSKFASAGKMEVDAMKEMFLRLMDKYQIKYKRYIGDGDSKTFKSVSEAMIYEKLRMGTRLRNAKKNNNIGGKGAEKLTDKIINDLNTYYGLVIRRNPKSVEEMKNAIWATFDHKRSTNVTLRTLS